MINCVIILSKWLWNHQPLASGSSVNITVLCFCYCACPLLLTLWAMISCFKRLKTKHSIFGTALQWFRCYLTDRAQIVLSCVNLSTDINIPPLTPGLGDFLVLDFRRWWRHVKKIYRWPLVQAVLKGLLTRREGYPRKRITLALTHFSFFKAARGTLSAC